MASNKSGETRTTDCLAAKAQALMKEARFDEAAEAWHECIVAYPGQEQGSWYHKRGICLLQAKRFAEAIRVFEELVERFPAHPGGEHALERAKLHGRIYEEFAFFGDIATTPREQWAELAQTWGSRSTGPARALEVAPIHCLWAEGNLTELAYASLMTFLQTGHHVRLFSYTPGELAIPQKWNLSVCAADEVVGREVYDECKKTAGVQYFSDIFRYAVLYERGGWWIDLDVLLVKELDFAGPYVLCTQYRGEFIVGNVLKAPKGASHMRRLLDESVRALRHGNTEYGEAGPRLLTRYVFSEGNEELKKFILPPIYFNAINWDEIQHLVAESPLASEVLKDSRVYGVHVWNKVWEMNGYSLSDARPQSVVGVLIGQLR